MTPPDAVAALRDDQATRWRRGDRVPAEQYLATHPALSDEDRLVLVAGELALRWERGEHPSAAEYAARFPAFADDLVVQFGLRQLVGGADPFARTPTAPARLDAPADRPAVPGYDLHEEIGRGGGGVVYRATHSRLGRPVALKVVRGGAADDPARAVRFLDEARVMAKLDHPHVLRVFEAGQTAGGLFLALELADAGTLADALLAGPLPPREAADLVAGVAAAAAAAHARGIVHRDIKPSNVLLLRSAESKVLSAECKPDSALSTQHSALCPKLADFGLAKQLDLGPGVTATGQVLGTPQYMAPEQAGGDGAVGPPADVYALGAVLYECLTGRPPLLGAGTMALLRQVQEQEPVSPRALNPAVPVDLATVALKCLEKEPARRYPTAAGLEADLRRFLAGEPVTARPVGAAERVWRWARRHPREATLGGLVASLLLALVGGSVGAAALLKRQRDAAVAAEQGTDLARLDAERLIARQTREAGRLGQRAAGLDAVRRRWDATPAAGRTPGLRLALRSEVAAALTAVDYEPVGEWAVGTAGFHDTDAPPADPRRYAVNDPATGDTMIAGDPPVRLGPPVGHYRLRKFSPDGRTLLEGCFWVAEPQRGRLRAWDWAAGRLLFDRPLAGEGSLLVDFHPDGRRLVAAEWGNPCLLLLDAATGAEVGRSPPRFRPRALAVHPDGRRVAVAEQYRPLAVADLADGWREVARPAVVDADALAWAADGRHLAAVRADGAVAVWDAAAGTVRTAPGPHHAGPRRAAFADPTTLVTSSTDGVTQVWEVPALRPLVRLPGRLVRAAADGRHVLTADDRRVVLYRRADAGEYRELPPVFATAAVPSPDGALLVTSDPGGPTVWAADTLRPLAWLGLDDCGPAAFDPAGGRLVTFGRFSKVRVWPVADPGGGRRAVGPPAEVKLPQPRDPFLTPQHAGRAAAWAGGRLLAADHRDNRLAVLDPAGGPARVVGHQAAPTAVAGSPDGRWLAAASDLHPRLRVVAVADGAAALDRDGFVAVAFSPDGRWLAAAGWAGLAVYRTGDWGRPAWEVGPEVVSDAAAMAVAFRPDGRAVAVPVARDRVGLFDPAAGDRLLDLPLPATGAVAHLAFAPDGGRLYVSRWGTAAGVGVYDLRAVAARLAGLGLGHPADELPPAAPVPAVTAVTVDRRPPDGRPVPADHWAQQWMLLALGERLAGRWADAVHSATLALAYYGPEPGNEAGRAAILDTRAGYHLRAGSPAAARDDWRESLRLDPGRTAVAAKLAELLLAEADPDAAAAVLAAVAPALRRADWRAAAARVDAARGGVAAVAGGLAGW